METGKEEQEILGTLMRQLVEAYNSATSRRVAQNLYKVYTTHISLLIHLLIVWCVVYDGCI